MSIIAREWALRQVLAPVHKLILVVLADAADDQGMCWPRISTVAGKVGVSGRTVQRSVQYLVQRKLVTVEPRVRTDGSSSSNLYRLKLKEGGVNLSPPRDNVTPPPDKMTPLPDRGVTQGCHPCQGEGDTGVTPLTERRTEREPPQPQGPEFKTEPELPDRGGGKSLDLHYPKGLLPLERTRCEAMIARVDPLLAQQVLDEWAAIIAAGDIRSSPLGCLRALIDRACAGEFTPERGLSIAEGRKARRRVKVRAMERPELPAPSPHSPLVRRLNEVAQRQGERESRR